jgi:hypothetical protein
VVHFVLKAFHSLLNHKPKLLVAVEAVSPVGTDDADGTFVRISATNIGQRPIRVTSLTVELLGTKTLADCPPVLSGCPDTPMPATLAPGEVAHVTLDLRDIADRLLELGAWTVSRLYGQCTDSSGGIHRSKPWSFTPNPLDYQIG